MDREKVVIWGASGHALVVADIIRLRGDYRIIGFLDDINPQSHNTKFCNLPILGGVEQLDKISREGVKNLIFGFGDCGARLKLAQLVRSKGFDLITAIHPQAIVAADAVIGEGTVIAAGAVVNPATKIGNNVIINTSAGVDHECVIEDGAHICPGVHLGGKVIVGQAAWVGIGSTIKDGVKIGKRSLVGAGSVVLNDIPPEAAAYGVPARVQKKRVSTG